MPKIDIAEIVKWLQAGEAVLGSPLVARLLPSITAELSLTPEQRAQLDANYAEGLAYRNRAAAGATDAGIGEHADD